MGGNFDCTSNQLTSLKGAPTSVGGDFYCFNNQLTSLKGAPTSVGGNFDYDNNPTKFIKQDVRSVCNIKGKTIISFWPIV